MNTSPESLRELIASLGISQRECARRIGLNPRKLRAYLSNPEASTHERCPVPVAVAIRSLVNK